MLYYGGIKKAKLPKVVVVKPKMKSKKKEVKEVRGLDQGFISKFITKF